MAFTIYPDAATAALLGVTANSPVKLTAGSAMSQFAPLAGPVGPDPTESNLPTTFISISMSNPVSAAPPKVELIAVNPGAATQGGAVTITATSIGAAQGLSDGINGTDAASAYFDPPSYANNVYLLKVIIDIANTTLKIRITNNTVVDRKFVWVVADSANASQQPWIDATPAVLSYTALINQTADKTGQPITIDNHGTGPLTADLSPAIAAPYTVSGLPVILTSNPAVPAAISIGFNAPATTGTTAPSVFSLTGDSGAVAVSAGHNNQITLSATTTKLEVVMLLDDSGSMGQTPNDQATNNPSLTRWSELKSASKLFLDLLAGFGANAGTIGLVKFPGKNGQPDTDLTSYDLLRAETIPATMTSVQNLLDPIVPFNNTPMDFGIQRVLTAVAPSYFANDATSINSNRRWMLLMSDGAWNDGADPRMEITSLAAKKIMVYSAGYGTTGEVDYATLQALSTGPGTTPGGISTQVDTGTPLTAQQLADKFKLAIKTGLTSISSALDPTGVLTSNQPEARHPVIITPYDTKAVFLINWNTPDANRMMLQLQTPGCDLLTPESVKAGAFPGVTFRNELRYQMYIVDGSYLRNDADPSHPRSGTWKMIVSSPELSPIQILAARPAAAVIPSEHYSYDVMTESSLRLEVTLDRQVYYAGDPINVTAKLILNGLPLTQASVKLDVNMPTQSRDNWLAGVPVTATEYANAANQLAGRDINAIFIKSFAAGLKGFTFTNTPASATIPMIDVDNDGIYTASVVQTSVPDSYKLNVTAVGTTPDGVVFNRERSLEVIVGVRPVPQFTLIDIVYAPLQHPGVTTGTVIVTPRDQFLNVKLIDPATSHDIVLLANGGTLDPKLTTTFNGSYSASLSYPAGATPTLSLSVAGNPVITNLPVAPVDQLRFVDQVLSFKPGLEAVQGANHHANPNDALNDIRTKPVGSYLATGGYGSLVVGVNGQVILARSDDDVTVFVQPTDVPRPYRVEAQPTSGAGQWVTLGTSGGTTSSFSLHTAGIASAGAIRITDESGITRDGAFQPSDSPGTLVRAVGIRTVAPATAAVGGCERFFIGYFSDGGVASVANFHARFVSPIDKYAYQQSEVSYEYYLHSTRAPAPGFVQGQQTTPTQANLGGGPGNLLYLLWDVDDLTGRVSLQTSYYVQEKQETPTHDGCVKIYATCQRRPGRP